MRFNFCRIKNNNKCFLLPDIRFTLEDTKLDDNIDNKDLNNFDDTVKYLQSLHSKYNYKNKKSKFYSYKLKNNINYILFNNESELTNIFNYLESNEKLSNNIIQNNKYFVNNILTYNNI
jgi:hypothetical protein